MTNEDSLNDKMAEILGDDFNDHNETEDSGESGISDVMSQYVIDPEESARQEAELLAGMSEHELELLQQDVTISGQQKENEEEQKQKIEPVMPDLFGIQMDTTWLNLAKHIPHYEDGSYLDNNTVETANNRGAGGLSGQQSESENSGSDQLAEELSNELADLKKDVEPAQEIIYDRTDTVPEADDESRIMKDFVPPLPFCYTDPWSFRLVSGKISAFCNSRIHIIDAEQIALDKGQELAIEVFTLLIGEEPVSVSAVIYRDQDNMVAELDQNSSACLVSRLNTVG